jgi:hypothetical protein
MANLGLELTFQRLGNPLAERASLSASLNPHASGQALRQFDAEDLFGFRDRQRAGLLLGGRYVAGRLARGNAKLDRQRGDSFRPGLLLVQKLDSLVHAPVILGCGGSTQDDTSILPYTSKSR